jgi:hypothetical protein
MKKKWVIICFAVLLAGGIFLYCYLHPQISLGVFEPVDPSGNFVETPALSSGTYFGLPLPSNIESNIRNFTDANDSIISDIYNNYSLPHRITCDIEVQNGQTFVTYSGTVTDSSGRQIEYYKKLTFDYIITDSIEAKRA